MPNPEQKSDGRVFDKTSVTLMAVGIFAIGISGLIVLLTPGKVPAPLTGQSSAVPASAVAAPANRDANVVWATSAPGRVEPKGGNVHLRPEASGRIVKVYAAAGEQVRQGDLLLQLRDDEAKARLTQARAEVAVRLGERDEEQDGPEKNQLVLDRRKAADELALAERALFKAWREFDRGLQDHRAGRASDGDLAAVREGITKAEKAVEEKTDAFTIIKAKKDMPLPTRLDSGLTLARADLRLAEIAYQNTRVRAPVDGTLLRLDATQGEMASPSQRRPIAVLGDMSVIQITAEVQERDVSKVRVGQEVVVRSNAFEQRDFIGKVTEIAPSVGSPGLRAQGPRQQLDVEVLEVKIELEGKPPVMPGMRVDVFFRSGQRVSSVNR